MTHKVNKTLTKRKAAKPSRSAEEYKIRIRNLHAKWVQGTASKSAIDELLVVGEANGGISPKEVRERQAEQPELEDIPSSVSGMDALGALIMRQFPKIGLQVNRQTIQNWRQLKYVPKGCSVPFPPPSSGNRYNVAECFAWIQTYFGPRMETVGGMDLSFQRRQEMKDRIDAATMRMKEREDAHAAGLLTDTKEAQMAVTGAVLAHHAIVKARLDRDFAKLVLEKLEGIDELTRHKIQDAVTEIGRGIVKDIEDDCAKYGK